MNKLLAQVSGLIKLKKFNSIINITKSVKLSDQTSQKILLLRAYSFLQLHQFTEAISVIDSIPVSTDSLMMKGSALSGLNKDDIALEIYNKIISENAGYLLAHYNRANLFRKIKRSEEALAGYKYCLEKDPSMLDAQLNTALVLQSLNQDQDALKLFNDLIVKQSNYNNLISRSLSLIKLGCYSDAEVDLLNAQKIDPTRKSAYINLCSLYVKTHSTDKAFEIYNNFPKICNSEPELLTNIGVCHTLIGDDSSASNFFQKALSVDSKCNSAIFNLGSIELKNHHFENGWRGYHQGIFTGEREVVSHTIPVEKELTSTNIPYGSRIIIFAEQGVGDEILFLSTLFDIAEFKEKLGLHIAIYCDKRIHFLISNVHRDKFTLLQRGSDISGTSVDYYIHMGDLGKIFRNSISDFSKYSSPYLLPSSKLIDFYKNEFSTLKHKNIIGISWKTFGKLAGNERSINLIDFLKKINIENAVFVNLQYGDVENEIDEVLSQTKLEIIKIDNIDMKNDIEHIAAIALCCDEIFTIDNYLAHLCGALNLKAKICLPNVSNWRWGCNETSSLWYPSVKLVRDFKSLQIFQ